MVLGALLSNRSVSHAIYSPANFGLCQCILNNKVTIDTGQISHLLLLNKHFVLGETFYCQMMNSEFNIQLKFQTLGTFIHTMLLQCTELCACVRYRQWWIFTYGQSLCNNFSVAEFFPEMVCWRLQSKLPWLLLLLCEMIVYINFYFPQSQ